MTGVLASRQYEESALLYFEGTLSPGDLLLNPDSDPVLERARQIRAPNAHTPDGLVLTEIEGVAYVIPIEVKCDARNPGHFSKIARQLDPKNALVLIEAYMGPPTSQARLGKYAEMEILPGEGILISRQVPENYSGKYIVYNP